MKTKVLKSPRHLGPEQPGLRDANSNPLAVHFEAMLEEFSDEELHRVVLSRMGERSRAIEVGIEAI